LVPVGRRRSAASTKVLTIGLTVAVQLIIFQAKFNLLSDGYQNPQPTSRTRKRQDNL